MYNGSLVCRINPPVEQGSLQYNMTRLAMTLNTAEPELLRQLPPTDSRLRPDQRALEVRQPARPAPWGAVVVYAGSGE